MKHYLVKCETVDHEYDFFVCLTHEQLDKLEHKITNNMITYPVPISYGSDVDNDKITIITKTPITKSAYLQIKDAIGNEFFISNICEKTKMCFWYTCNSKSQIIKDFVSNTLEKLDHPDYAFVFCSGGMGSLHISEHKGNITLSNEKYKRLEISYSCKNDIMNFLIQSKN